MQGYCDYLNGVCILQQAVECFIENKGFEDPELREMLHTPGDVKLVTYEGAAEETAKVLISFKRQALAISNVPTLNAGGSRAVFKPQVTVVITISAQTYYLAEKLGQEIAQYIARITNALMFHNINIASVSLSETVTSPEHANFYRNVITVSAGIPHIMWKMETSEDIVNSIRLRTTFNGQDILTTTKEQ